MNAYRVTIATGSSYNYTKDEVYSYVNDDTADRIHALEIGETLVDDDGYTWERIA
jgi:hypothetical protein